MTSNRNWDAFALLLIDVQRDFWSERLVELYPDFPANVERLLAFCREEGIEVVHLRAAFAPDMSDWMIRYRLLGRIPCIEGTEGIETEPFALEQPGETVIVKRTFDGFIEPALLAHLQAGGKRFVLTAGLVTSVCVFTTTISAAQRGFLAAMVADCCADAPAMHEHASTGYPFAFDTTSVADLAEDWSRWMAMLAGSAEL